jgi:phosphate transport system protein
MEFAIDRKLGEVRSQLNMMAGLAERNVHMTLRAFIDRQAQPSETVIAEDRQINALETAIDNAIIIFIATHGPTASDCRFMFIAGKLTQNFERIGDHAASIAHQNLRLIELDPAMPHPEGFEKHAQIAESMLSDSLGLLVRGTHELPAAHDVIRRMAEVARFADDGTRQMIEGVACSGAQIEASLAHVTAIRGVERIAHQAKAIAQLAVYLHDAQDIRHQD